MNGDLVPAVVAAGGGSAMLAGVYLHEHRQVEAMRRSRVRLALVYPLIDPAQGKAVLHALSGLADVELIFEVVADSDGIRHAMWVPATSQASVTATLTGLLPGLRVSEAPSPQGRATLALKVFVPTPTALVIENPEAAVRTLLSGLAALNQGEEVVIRWALRPSTAPSLRAPESMDRAAKERERVWRQKTVMTGGFQVSGLILVRAGSVARARGLSEHIASSLRSRRGSVGALRLTSEHGGRSLASLPKITRSSGWLNAAELLVLTLPVSEEVIPGMEVSLTRQIAPRKELARTGRPLFVAEYQGQPRPVALSTEAATRHVAILGASGGGKSTILAAGINFHIAAGHGGGVVIDPKGDLVSTVIERADKGAERIVVLDPSADVVPGVDLFSGGDPDLRAEVLVQIFRGLFKDAWGPRTDAYIRLGVRTLADVPGSTLLDLPQLFLDAQARRRAVGFLSDPLLIGQWQVFDGLSEVERMQHLQAPLSRVLSLITRPPVQAVFGPDPRLDVAQLLRDRGWLLVPLSSGVIGAASARIIGSALTSIVWSHISSRAAIPPEQRHPLFLFFDELQALTDQGIGLEDLLEQSRGYNASVTIATQAIGRTPDQLRHSLLSNVSTLVSLRAGATEATLIARELGLAARDIQFLPPYHVAARVATGKGSGSIVVTGHTEPLGEPVGGGQRIRQRSAQAFGRSRAEIQAAIRERYGMAPDATDTSIELGRTRRQA
jgi:hypothetical protein